ncbi:MAG: HAD-IIA family hydrolase [Oscillospiraceae bacterium]|nr:HAD-IIA family hydrolase [Oscillospiraceae bacterium]
MNSTMSITTPIGNICDIELFMLDMDGTIYLGDSLFDCTIPFLDKLKEKKIDYLFLTNNSSKDKKEYLAKLSRLGIETDAKQLLTSGDVTIEYIKEHYPNQKVFLVGTTALERAFAEAGLILSEYEKADLVVVGFDTSLNYEKLNGIYQMVMKQKPYLCTHPDMVCPTEDGYIPDIGATIAYVESITGRLPDSIIGKPKRYMIDAAAERFDVSPERIAMVGDRLYTDIAMAVDAGIMSILVLSGETKAEDLKDSPIQPVFTFADLSSITNEL